MTSSYNTYFAYFAAWGLVLALSCVGSTTLSAPSVVLRVEVDPDQNRVSGTAVIASAAPVSLDIATDGLRTLEVDGVEMALQADSVTVNVPGGGDIHLTFEAAPPSDGVNVIDADNVVLTHSWYPLPLVLATYRVTVTLPAGFIAVSEAENIRSRSATDTITHDSVFDHPLPSVSLVASRHYTVSRKQHRNIDVEAYFFGADQHLADQYLAAAVAYIADYEQLLTPFPYSRFAIVETITHAGNSFPTFTLLGQSVVRLPFIVDASLRHEIAHQWFGSSVYVDYASGNWCEGLTTYLADHRAADLKGEGSAYRKALLVDYDAYIAEDNASSVRDFRFGSSKTERALGYGRAMMIFHMLKGKIGEGAFYTALRDVAEVRRYEVTSWDDLQAAFEAASDSALQVFFQHWLDRSDVPEIAVSAAGTIVLDGIPQLELGLRQRSPPYPMSLPVVMRSDAPPVESWLPFDEVSATVTVPVPVPPASLIVDPAYHVMRALSPAETPPVLAAFLARPRVTAIIAEADVDRYRPVLAAMHLQNCTEVIDDSLLDNGDIAFDTSLVITGFDSRAARQVFGRQAVPVDDVRLVVARSPWHRDELVMVLQVNNTTSENQVVGRKLRRYGKYTELAFTDGRNTHKSVAATADGIHVPIARPVRVTKPGPPPSIPDMLRDVDARSVVFVGEQHDQYAHHINQLQIIRTLHERHGATAVGMEMFPATAQDTLNAYIAGTIEERQFLRQSGYYRVWGFDYTLYKPILDYARENKIPVIGLNLDRELVSRVARVGLQRVGDTDLLPAGMDLTNTRYRDDLRPIFTAHMHGGIGHDDRRFEYFVQAQAVWDESMADHAARFLNAHPDVILVVLAGNGHIRYGYGIPDRLSRRYPSRRTTILQDDDTTEGIADFVLQTETIPGRGAPLLGVMIENENDSLLVRDIVTDSAAARSDIHPGDRITAVAGEDIRSLEDLKIALFFTNRSVAVPVSLIRNGTTVETTVLFAD